MIFRALGLRCLGQLYLPLDVAIGLDDNLYVSPNSTSGVIRFNVTTGAKDEFTDACLGMDPWGLVFAPDGFLYVASTNQGNVLKFNGATGDCIGNVASPGGALTFLFYCPTLIEGDLDGNGYVGSHDLDIVRSHWGDDVTPGSLIEGDPSGDGIAGSTDLDIVRENWGNTAEPVAVPEPTIVLLLITGAACLLWRRDAHHPEAV